MDFEFDNLDTVTLAEKGVRFVPKSIATGEPLLAKNGKEVSFVLHGADSARYRAAMRAATRARIDAAAAAAQAGEPPAGPDIADEDAHTIAVLAACISGWENVFTPDGEAIPFTVAAVTALLAKHIWLREQIDVFVTRRRNFMKAS